MGRRDGSNDSVMSKRRDGSSEMMRRKQGITLSRHEQTLPQNARPEPECRNIFSILRRRDPYKPENSFPWSLDSRRPERRPEEPPKKLSLAWLFGPPSKNNSNYSQESIAENDMLLRYNYRSPSRSTATASQESLIDNDMLLPYNYRPAPSNRSENSSANVEPENVDSDDSNNAMCVVGSNASNSLFRQTSSTLGSSVARASVNHYLSSSLLPSREYHSMLNWLCNTSVFMKNIPPERIRRQCSIRELPNCHSTGEPNPVLCQLCGIGSDSTHNHTDSMSLTRYKDECPCYHDRRSNQFWSCVPRLPLNRMDYQRTASQYTPFASSRQNKEESFSTYSFPETKHLRKRRTFISMLRKEPSGENIIDLLCQPGKQESLNRHSTVTIGEPQEFVTRQVSYDSSVKNAGDTESSWSFIHYIHAIFRYL